MERTAKARIVPDLSSLSWRIRATAVIAFTGIASKIFLYGLNRTEVQGLDEFVKILEERRDPAGRERGLLTGL